MVIKAWKNKNGRVQYPLPNCKRCGKRSNTTDKETAQIAKRIGRICQECIKKAIKQQEENLSIVNEREKKKSIWQKIKSWFK